MPEYSSRSIAGIGAASRRTRRSCPGSSPPNRANDSYSWSATSSSARVASSRNGFTVPEGIGAAPVALQRVRAAGLRQRDWHRADGLAVRPVDDGALVRTEGPDAVAVSYTHLRAHETRH